MKPDLGKFLGKPFAPIALCLVLSGCAQLGAPLPPSLELPKAPTDLRFTRKGNHVSLTWSEPTLTTDRQSVRYLGPTLVCRSLDTEITACGNPVAMLPAPAAAPAPKSHSIRPKPQRPAPQKPALEAYTDTLPTSLIQPNPSAEITYAVEVLNRNARGAGLSNRIHVPAILTLPPPADLSANLTGNGVTLNWTSTGEPQNHGNNAASIQYLYRIYRRDESSGKDSIAGEIPVGQPGPEHFTDSGFEWEKTYLYRVTAVTIVKRPDSEIQVEGDDTPPLRVVAHDIFPPSVPSGLQAVYSGQGQKPFIDLIWAPVTNSDLAGYNVYRSEAGAEPVKLNSEPVKSPAYRDFAVTSGKTYTYSISAIDVRGNQSQRSEPASESVP